MAYIQVASAKFGAAADKAMDGGATAAVKEADKGTLEAAFKAQAIMTETVIETGSIAATNSSFNQGLQQAANK